LTKHNKWNEKNPRTNKQTNKQYRQFIREHSHSGTVTVEKQQTNKPERKKIESIPVVPQSTKMTKKRNMDENKTNYY